LTAIFRWNKSYFSWKFNFTNLIIFYFFTSRTIPLVSSLDRICKKLSKKSIQSRIYIDVMSIFSLSLHHYFGVDSAYAAMDMTAGKV